MEMIAIHEAIHAFGRAFVLMCRDQGNFADSRGAMSFSTPVSGKAEESKWMYLLLEEGLASMVEWDYAKRCSAQCSEEHREESVWLRGRKLVINGRDLTPALFQTDIVQTRNDQNLLVLPQLKVTAVSGDLHQHLGYPTLAYGMLKMAREFFPTLDRAAAQRAWLRVLLTSQIRGSLGEVKDLFRKTFGTEHAVLYRRALAEVDNLNPNTPEGQNTTLAFISFVQAGLLKRPDRDFIRKQICNAILANHD